MYFVFNIIHFRYLLILFKIIILHTCNSALQLQVALFHSTYLSIISIYLGQVVYDWCFKIQRNKKMIFYIKNPLWYVQHVGLYD